MSGGTRKFMLEELGYDKSSSCLQQYAKDLAFLQQIYSINFTSNMFENMACILGRGKEVNDLFYYIPWVTSDVRNNIPTCSIAGRRRKCMDFPDPEFTASSTLSEPFIDNAVNTRFTNLEQ